MRGKSLFALVCLTITFPVSAQTIVGVSIGSNVNNLQTNIFTLTSFKIQPQFGYSISLLFNYMVNKKFSIAFSSDIVQKNYTLKRTGIYSGVFEKHNNSYLQLPIYSCYTIFRKKKILLSLNAGMYVGYWLLGRVKGNIPDIFSATDSTNLTSQTVETFRLSSYNRLYAFNSQRDKRIETGYSAGIGLMYDLNKRQQFHLSFNFLQSLTDQQKKYFLYQVPRYNQTYVLQLGYTFTLPVHTH